MKSPQILRGSFSAVWTAMIATRYSVCSIFEIYKIFILLHRSDLKISAKSSTFLKEWSISKNDIPFSLRFSMNFNFLRFFCENLFLFAGISQKIQIMFRKWYHFSRFWERSALHTSARAQKRRRKIHCSYFPKELKFSYFLRRIDIFRCSCFLCSLGDCAYSRLAKKVKHSGNDWNF